jgi:transglutaminase-like putative cysteine protease
MSITWPGWRHLPREARDTLFLLAVIGWTVLPHLAHLPWWCGALTAMVLAWRARLALTNATLPNRWLVIAVLLVAASLTAITERTLLGKEAGVTMLVMLMVLKTLELRAKRDALVVFFLGFFLVLTNFLYSQSLLVALAMLVSVWGLMTALVLAHMPIGQPSLRQAGGLAARAALLGAPIMVALFVLFPRIGPLWALPADGQAKTGLSGTLRMGAMASVANDDSIAFRLRFDGPGGQPPPQQQLYFRGPVLGGFDGVEWRRLDRVFSPVAQLPPDLRTSGQPVGYEMTLEPQRSTVLPLLEATPDRPEDAPGIVGWTASQRADLQWTTDRPVHERLRFHARAWPHFEHGPPQHHLGLIDYTALPADHNPRTLAWAAALRRQPAYAHADARTLAQAVLQHIASGGYVYTLTPGEYGSDAVDEFWLDRRQGFCEHYAASFVVILRALGVPARIVTGYQGTDPKPVDGYWIVRQSHAHAWAEYWQPGHGWVRADPTASVAPDRVVRGRALEPSRGLVAGALDSVNPALLADLRLMWERANNRWNQWVLGYSRAEQFNLLERLGFSNPNWADLSLVLIGLLSGASLAGAGWAWWDRHRQDPWQRLQAAVRRRLQRLDVPAEPHDTPRALAARVSQRWGRAGEALAGRLLELDRLRYAAAAIAQPSRTWWRGFAADAARLRSRR